MNQEKYYGALEDFENVIGQTLLGDKSLSRFKRTFKINRRSKNKNK